MHSLVGGGLLNINLRYTNSTVTNFHFIPEELGSVVPHQLSTPTMILLIMAVEWALADERTCAVSHIQLIISTSSRVRDQNNDSLGSGVVGNTVKYSL